MRIFMQARAEDEGAPRYCHFILQEDLLGGWTLVREWGRQGGRRSTRREHYDTREAAEAALMAARDDQIRRGFSVMFTQGGEG